MFTSNLALLSSSIRESVLVITMISTYSMTEANMCGSRQQQNQLVARVKTRGEYSHIFAIRVCAAGEGMVFKPFGLVKGMIFKPFGLVEGMVFKPFGLL